MVQDIAIAGFLVTGMCGVLMYAPQGLPNTLGALLIGFGVLGVLAIMGLRR